MKWLACLLAWACCLALAAGANVPIITPHDAPAVQVDLKAINPHLTPANFTQATAHGAWFIKFYVGYCPHCRRLAPIWQKVAEEQAELKRTRNFHMAQVDCVAYGQFCDQQLVDGYPTMFLYHNGAKLEDQEYPDERQAEPLTQYALSMSEKHKFAPEPLTTSTPAAAPTKSLPAAASQAVTDDKPKTPAQPEDVGKYNIYGKNVALTQATFADTIKEGPWFVKFFAPWCVHCQHLAPIWTELSQNMRGKINIAEVDCMAEAQLCSEKEIQGYPTMIFYLEGSHTTYTGDRTVEELSRFALEAFGSQQKEVASRHELDAVTADLETWFLYLFDEKSDAKLLETVRKNAMAMLMQSHLFTSQDLGLLNGSLAFPRADTTRATTPSLWVYKDGYMRPYRGLLDDTTAVREWMARERYPLVPEMTTHNAKQFFDKADLVVMTIIDTDLRRVSDTNINAWKLTAREAADEFYKIQTGQSALNPAAIVDTPPATMANANHDATFRKIMGLSTSANGDATSSGGDPEAAVHGIIRTQKIQFVWLDIAKWDKYLHRVFGMSRTMLPRVLMTRPKDEVYFDSDASHSPLRLSSSQQLVATVKASLRDELPASYTNGFLVGSIRSSYRRITGSLGYAMAHPLKSFVFLAVVAGAFYYFYRLRTEGRFKPQKAD
ncbi:hypothetical protein H4R35_002233 [Dimargaris xerosporica]|nr:hypothetical protein H4R35_002233 [Dimargaris xerosporica]